jgi:hypothetical protein
MQFFIGAAKGRCPQWRPNANPIESWHNTLNTIPGVIMRASFTNMLEVNIPAICKDASVNLAATGWLLQPTCIPYEMAEAAMKRAKKGPLPMHNADKTVWKVVSRSYWEKHPKAVMDTEFLKRYTASLRGSFPAGVSKKEAQEIATSVHTIVRDPRCKGPCNPGWRCNCKKFVELSTCSCCLSIAENDGSINVSALLEK